MPVPFWLPYWQMLVTFTECYPNAISFLLCLFGAYLVTYPTGWLLRWLLSSKKELLEKSGEPQADAGVETKLMLTKPARGFPDGGAVIGRLERLLIYLFVLSGELGAVGFLVAAKSIFRFGELTNQQNRLEAEYIIIGTLMSFVIGLVASIGFRWLIHLVLSI